MESIATKHQWKLNTQIKHRLRSSKPAPENVLHTAAPSAFELATSCIKSSNSQLDSFMVIHARKACQPGTATRN